MIDAAGIRHKIPSSFATALFDDRLPPEFERALSQDKIHGFRVSFCSGVHNNERRWSNRLAESQRGIGLSGVDSIESFGNPGVLRAGSASFSHKARGDADARLPAAEILLHKSLPVRISGTVYVQLGARGR